MDSNPNTVFVLGAGFSFEQGYPLASDLRNHVISFLESNRNTMRGFLKPWNGGYQRGQFYEGLEMIEGNDELPFEELLIKLKERIKTGENGPFHITNDQIRIGARRVLWEIHNSTRIVGPAYKSFAERLRLNQNGNSIISFNWDLQAERLLNEAGIPWCYWPVGRAEVIPVIKPHGSINWNSYRRQGYSADYTGWTTVHGTRLSYDSANPLLDHELDDVIPQLSHLLYPGDSDRPESDNDLELLWRDASYLLDDAEEIVFIGYSFPSYDQHSRYFFTNKVKNKTVIAINPSSNDLQKLHNILGEVAGQINLCPQSFGKCRYAQPQQISA